MPDGCARTVISLEANALLSHEVVNTPPPRGCFRISTVLWLYPTEPIQRDYTPLRTMDMSPEEVAAYGTDAHSAAIKKGRARMGPDRRSAASKKGRAKMSPDRRRAVAKRARSFQKVTSVYSRGVRTLAQKEKTRKAGALPSVFMSAHKVVLSPHPN